MLAVARGQDQDPPSNSIILALWRGPGSPLSAAACSPKCKAHVSLLSASLPSLATLGDARASYPAISPLCATTCTVKSHCGHQRAPTFHGGQNGCSSPGQSFTVPHSLSVPCALDSPSHCDGCYLTLAHKADTPHGYLEKK